MVSEYQTRSSALLRTGTVRGLANYKLPFRLIEIVHGNFKIELEKNEE
jgi:hypothetical protein